VTLGGGGKTSGEETLYNPAKGATEKNFKRPDGGANVGCETEGKKGGGSRCRTEGFRALNWREQGGTSAELDANHCPGKKGCWQNDGEGAAQTSFGWGESSPNNLKKSTTNEDANGNAGVLGGRGGGERNQKEGLRVEEFFEGESGG